MPTTPTPGAVRAAKRLWQLFQPCRAEMEDIIDEETHAGELRAALRKISVHSSYTPGDAGNISFAYDSVREIARVAIAATGEK